MPAAPSRCGAAALPLSPVPAAFGASSATVSCASHGEASTIVGSTTTDTSATVPVAGCAARSANADMAPTLRVECGVDDTAGALTSQRPAWRWLGTTAAAGACCLSGAAGQVACLVSGGGGKL